MKIHPVKRAFQSVVYESLGEEFPEQIGKGLLGRDKVHDFLENLDLILCERVTQQDKTRSIRLRSDNVIHQ